MIKYHNSFLHEIGFLLIQEDALNSLLIVTDYNDPHPEEDLHKQFTHNIYKNRVNKLNLAEFTEQIFFIIDRYLLTDQALDALNLLVFCLDQHVLGAGFLTNLYSVTKSSMYTEFV